MQERLRSVRTGRPVGQSHHQRREWGGRGFNASQHLAALNLNGGNATLSSNGNRILVAGASAISGGGKLDLADNALIVDYGGASPLPTVQSYINSGRNGGAWNGSGINSSAAAANSGRAVGSARRAA